jgi:PhzF family phenazine biosynthesis protein
MAGYRFRIVNVFAESTFGGNPLCVFEDAAGMDDRTMQALARQFNLSETTFLFPSQQADAHMRIFTPSAEMPFAGHPTLGTAHVLRASRGGDSLSLECRAGVVPVTANGDAWTFTAPAVGLPAMRAADASPAFIAGLVGLSEGDLAGEPAWVNTGNEQLLIPLRDAGAVARAAPDARLLPQWPASRAGRKNAYVFAFDGGTSDGDGGDAAQVVARYFFTQPGGGMAEDPGTGSACANLGGWLIATGKSLPARCLVSQGEAIGRRCRLSLEVTAERAIRVGGRVIELGRGSVEI